jgi:hypothetical protein
MLRCPVAGFSHLVVVGSQQIPQDLPVVHLILDHKNAFRPARLACSLTMIGSVKEKQKRPFVMVITAAKGMLRHNASGRNGTNIKEDRLWSRVS